jgi:hypothetical protein
MNISIKSFTDKKNNEIFQSLSLGWDAASEHEWGIHPLKTKFGVDQSRRISAIPEGFHMGFHHIGGQYVSTLPTDAAFGFLTKYRCEDLITSFWDKDDFLVTICPPTQYVTQFRQHQYYRSMLNQLYAAISRLEARIYLTRAGLGYSLVIERIYG